MSKNTYDFDEYFSECNQSTNLEVEEIIYSWCIGHYELLLVFINMS
jgi:hypothetical protein